MDGGYRGKIHLVPQLPIGSYRNHIVWVSAAMTAFDEFFTALFKDHASTELSLARPRVPVRALDQEAHAERVRDELDDRIQRRRLAADERDRRARDDVSRAVSPQRRRARRLVGEDSRRPTTTRSSRSAGQSAGAGAVRAERHEGPRDRHLLRVPAEQRRAVHEYAAELAVRYFKEQTEMLAAGKLKPAFKCGPPENARAWQALVDEFFAGRDLVPLLNARTPRARGAPSASARSRVRKP